MKAHGHIVCVIKTRKSNNYKEIFNFEEKKNAENKYVYVHDFDSKFSNNGN